MLLPLPPNLRIPNGMVGRNFCRVGGNLKQLIKNSKQHFWGEEKLIKICLIKEKPIIELAVHCHFLRWVRPISTPHFTRLAMSSNSTERIVSNRSHSWYFQNRISYSLRVEKIWRNSHKLSSLNTFKKTVPLTFWNIQQMKLSDFNFFFVWKNGVISLCENSLLAIDIFKFHYICIFFTG